jgi:hypothetical protein
MGITSVEQSCMWYDLQPTWIPPDCNNCIMTSPGYALRVTMPLISLWTPSLCGTFIIQPPPLCIDCSVSHKSISFGLLSQHLWARYWSTVSLHLKRHYANNHVPERIWSWTRFILYFTRLITICFPSTSTQTGFFRGSSFNYKHRKSTEVT